MRKRITKIHTMSLSLNMLCNSKNNKGDKCNTCYTVGFETVSCWADAVSRIVTSTVSNNTGISRIILLDFETIFIRSEPISAIFVKIPPAILSA